MITTKQKLDFSENSLAVLKRRYLRKGADGEPAETVEEMFQRVAYHVAKADADAGGDVAETGEKFYDLLTELRFFPNSPTFTGADTPLGQLAACFVLPIEDDMGKHPDGIFQTLRNAVLIQQTGGGNGFAFSRLRPKGALVKTSMGKSTGPIGFLRVYDKAFGVVQQGGCLTPDTLVFTDNGCLRLDEIVDQSTDGWQPHNLKVSTDEGIKQSPNGYNNGVAQVLTVTTDEGISLTGTPNHKVKVMSDDGIVWKQLDELKQGDSILMMLGQHSGKLRALRRVDATHFNQKEIGCPTVLDEPLAFILGYMTGNGFVASADDDHRVGFSVPHKSYLMKGLPELLQIVFPDCTILTQQKKDDASVTFVINSAIIKKFFVQNGLSKSNSVNASVPKLVRQSPKEIVGAYLRGLFESDGTVSHGYPSLNTTSKRLLNEVATLLIGLGCPVTLREMPHGEGHYGESTVYGLRIHSFVGLQSWKDSIGCDKESRFISCYEFNPDLEKEVSYQLPNPSWWLSPVLEEITLPQVDAKGRGLGLKMRSKNPLLRKKLLRYISESRNLTYSGYKNLCKNYPEEMSQARAVGNYWFVGVKEVVSADASLTLDIEVDDNHTYIANGMVTHNTRRGANMGVLRVDHPDIEEFISCKAKEGEIANFNISVGITDEFMRAVESDSDFDLRFDGTVYKTVRAKDLFAEIVKYAHKNGEPGVLFLDAANRQNPVPHLYELEATNPCITGDTLVATPEGWRRADEINEGDEICTVLGTGIVATIETHESVPVYDVHFSDGGVVRATAAHQFHVRNSKTKFFEARSLTELAENDWVRVFKSAIPNNPVPQSTVELEDREFGFLIGVLVGDGCYTPRALSKNVVRISTHSDEEQWNEILHTKFSKIAAGKALSYVNKGSRSMTIDPKPGRAIADWVKGTELTPAISIEKSLPDAYINSNEQFLLGLLDGLFSTDGSVDLSSNHPIVRFHTGSRKLAQQVRLILLMFGIHGRVFETYRKSHSINGRPIRSDRPKYDVVISGQSFGRFVEQIKLSHPKKHYRLEEATLKCNFTGGNWAAQIKKIEPAGVAKVYDLYEPHSDTWITEGYVSRGCGEQYLGGYENCCLGSINLSKHLSADGGIDWELLQRSTVESTHFLDNVVTMNNYVPAVPQLREAALRSRRIGLGIMGLADMMYHLGIRYGSKEGQEFAGLIMEFVRYHCMKTSIELARQRGSFTAIKGSIYDNENFRWEIPQPLVQPTQFWNRPNIDWQQLRSDIIAHGIRNACQTTVAPTGTIATVAGCEGYGCEPVFALAYIRHVNDNGKDLELTYTSPLFEKALAKAGLDEATHKLIIDQVLETGTCQGIAELPEWIRNTFVVSADITADEHVEMQSAMQAFVDNSLSKTCNFPEGATKEDVARAYMKAWELGCKGLTVYVTGSRDVVVLETKSTKEAKEAPKELLSVPVEPVTSAEQLPLWNESKKPRSTVLRGETHRITTPLGTAYVTINANGDQQPFEVFVQTSKAGSETAAVSESIGRLISYVLRLSSPVPPRERLQEVVNQLIGIGGGRPLGFGANRVLSLPDGVAQVLSEYLQVDSAELPLLTEAVQKYINGTSKVSNGTSNGHHAQVLGDICPECGKASFVNEEGCRKCYSCAYSEC